MHINSATGRDEQSNPRMKDRWIIQHYSPPQQISSSIPQNLRARIEATWVHQWEIVPWHLAGACGLLGFAGRIIRPVNPSQYASLGKGRSRPCALSAGPLLLLFSLSEKCHYTVAKNTDTGMA